MNWRSRRRLRLTDVRERDRHLRAVLPAHRHVLLVGHRDDLHLAAPAERRGADPGALADEAPPVLRPTQGPLDAGGRDLQHVPRPDHRPGFQEALEGPADSRAVVGRDSLAGSAVRAVHPYLQDGALQRPDTAQIDELEPKAGDVVANRSEEALSQALSLYLGALEVWEKLGETEATAATHLSIALIYFNRDQAYQITADEYRQELAAKAHPVSFAPIVAPGIAGAQIEGRF